MARQPMKSEERKKKFTITINPEINKELEELNVNKSKLINWLLLEYFNMLSI